MNKFVSIVLAAGLVMASVDPLAAVVGGERAESGAWPWQVALYGKDKEGHFAFLCGGSLIRPDWVMTAATCLRSDAAEDYAVVEGTTHIDPLLQKKGAGKIILASKVVRHEQYDRTTNGNDIGLLHLDSPALSNPAQLSDSMANALEQPGTMAIVTGWGMVRPVGRDGRDPETGENPLPDDPKYYTQDLMQVEMPVVSGELCQSAHKNKTLDNRSICAGLAEGGKDACTGDSGGPLVARNSDGTFQQIGIVSWGRECGQKDSYGVYTRVSAFRDWLNQQTTRGGEK